MTGRQIESSTDGDDQRAPSPAARWAGPQAMHPRPSFNSLYCQAGSGNRMRARIPSHPQPAAATEPVIPELLVRARRIVTDINCLKDAIQRFTTPEAGTLTQ